MRNDRMISEDAKIEYYGLADKLEYLVTHNMTPAKQASEALKTAYEKAIEQEQELER